MRSNESNVLSAAEGQNSSNARVGVFFVYVIKTETNKLYIGHTNCLARRAIEHESSQHGAKFIHDNKSRFAIVYCEEFCSRAEAMRREKQLKGWTRAKKEALISNNVKLLGKL